MSQASYGSSPPQKNEKDGVPIKMVGARELPFLMPPQVVWLCLRLRKPLHCATIAEFKQVVSPFDVGKIDIVIDSGTQEVPLFVSDYTECDSRGPGFSVDSNQLGAPPHCLSSILNSVSQKQ